MKRLLFCILFTTAVLAGARDVHAQSRADSAAVLLHAAEQLRLRGETDAARALLQLIERQYAGTVAASEVERVRALLRRAPAVERSGRTELLVFGTTYGAWLGIATPLMFESNEASSYGLGLLLGAPIGFFAAKSYADTYAPTEGQTRALSFGGLWGTFQGFMLAEALDFGAETECFEGFCYESDGDDTALLTSGVVGGLLGITAGALIAQKPITSGTAAAVSLSGMWGSWFGFALAVLADADEDDGPLFATMLGGNAALALGAVAAPKWQMSESRARLISLGGVIGALGGFGVMLLLESEDNTAILFPLAGSAAGLAAGAHYTRDHDVRGNDGGGNSGALLNVRNGRWSVGAPVPTVQLQRNMQRVQPAAYVQLLQARF